MFLYWEWHRRCNFYDWNAGIFIKVLQKKCCILFYKMTKKWLWSSLQPEDLDVYVPDVCMHYSLLHYLNEFTEATPFFGSVTIICWTLLDVWQLTMIQASTILAMEISLFSFTLHVFLLSPLSSLGNLNSSVELTIYWFEFCSFPLVK